jgi:hypothetical protein
MNVIGGMLALLGGVVLLGIIAVGTPHSGNSVMGVSRQRYLYGRPI